MTDFYVYESIDLYICFAPIFEPLFYFMEECL